LHLVGLLQPRITMHGTEDIKVEFYSKKIEKLVNLVGFIIRIYYDAQSPARQMHNLFLVYFVKLYMFRAYLAPSSGGTTVCIQHLVFSILFR